MSARRSGRSMVLPCLGLGLVVVLGCLVAAGVVGRVVFGCDSSSKTKT